MQETQEMKDWSLGQEDPLEKGMATYSSILAWRNPSEEPCRLQSMGLHRVRHDQMTQQQQTVLALLLMWHDFKLSVCSGYSCLQSIPASISQDLAFLEVWWLCLNKIEWRWLWLSFPRFYTSVNGNLSKPPRPLFLQLFWVINLIVESPCTT